MAKEQKEPQEAEQTTETAPEEQGAEPQVTEPSDSGQAHEQPVDDAQKKPEKEEEIQELTTLHERTIAVLSYFSFLAIVPFYLKKDSKFCRFHGKQGLTLAIIFFLMRFFAVLDLIMDLMLILQALLALWLGFAALSGRWKRAPFVYNWSCQLEESLSLKSKDEEANDAALKPNQTKPDEEGAEVEGEQAEASENQPKEKADKKK